MKHIAVLDLGTNTFNLVIAEVLDNSDAKIVLSNKLPVKLGEGRINNGEIIPEAYTRGIGAIKQHYNTIQSFDTSKIIAYGTSALRSAKNGPQFTNEIEQLTGIKIQVISGDKEAELIYKGVIQTLSAKNEKFVILDIGGGSNEFIIADNKKIYWKKSYPLGIARLLSKFQPSDPISLSEIHQVENYLEQELADLFAVLAKHNVSLLVGASGSFETFAAMIKETKDHVSESSIEANSYPVTLNQFNALYKKLIRSTTKERQSMKGLESMRIEMIVLAVLFVNFILQKHNFKEILQSNFALKEGAVFDAIQQ